MRSSAAVPVLGIIAAVRLVKLAIVHAVIADCEGFLDRFERQINAPIFAVDGNLGIVIQLASAPKKANIS